MDCNCDHLYIAKAKGEVKLYFQDPVELLSIFADLEDENLALIQECREAESNLERIRTIVREVVVTIQLFFRSIKMQISCKEPLNLLRMPNGSKLSLVVT